MTPEASHDLQAQLKERTEELTFLSSQLLQIQEDERMRIAQDLHDSTIPSLSAIKLQLEGLIEGTTVKTPQSVRDVLKLMISSVEETMNEMRNIVMNLRPALLDDLGVVATISWFCRQFQATYAGFTVEKKLSLHEEQVPDALKITIFRILQEAMTNAAKHSRADSVSVSLAGQNGRTELTIHDNGEGFNIQQTRPGRSANGGFGLMSMRERVKLSSGSFSIESSEDTGTTVRASWEC